MDRAVDKEMLQSAFAESYRGVSTIQPSSC